HSPVVYPPRTGVRVHPAWTAALEIALVQLPTFGLCLNSVEGAPACLPARFGGRLPASLGQPSFDSHPPPVGPVRVEETKSLSRAAQSAHVGAHVRARHHSLAAQYLCLFLVTDGVLAAVFTPRRILFR